MHPHRPKAGKPDYVSSSMIEMDHTTEREAMLTIIGNLIKDNQSLKAENAILRTHVKAQPMHLH